MGQPGLRDADDTLLQLLVGLLKPGGDDGQRSAVLLAVLVQVDQLLLLLPQRQRHLQAQWSSGSAHQQQVVVFSFPFRGELVKCCFTSTETVGLLGTGAQDNHLDFHTAPELCRVECVCLVYVQWPSGSAHQ